MCDLVRGQAERGLRTGVVTSTDIGGASTDAALSALEPSCALHVHRIPMERTPGWSDLRAGRALEDICRKARPDIVHGHGAKGAAYARLLAPRLGAKAVYTPHGGSLHYSWATASGVVYLGLERLLKSRTDGMIFESGYALQTYEEKLGAAPRLHRVVYNGLHEHEFTPVPRGSEKYDFVFVGELRRLKGIYVLLEAVARLRAEHELSVLLVGPGDEEALIRARIRALDLDGSVALSPPIHPARDVFTLARCVVIPSLAESLPYIVLEVLASRVPLLTTRVGGIPEIFGPHSDRLLPPGAASALALAMKAFLADPVSAQNLAEDLHAHVKRRFLVPRMVDSVVDFYGDVVGSGPGGS